MTDEDLKNVTGYKLYAGSDAWDNYFFEIKAPEAPIVTTESEVLSVDAGANGQTYGTINYDFIPQLDMSSSDGTLVLRYWADVKERFHVHQGYIYLNGKSIKLPEWFSATTEKQDYVINLADYGMTTEDLKKVEAVVVVVAAQGEQSNFYVQLAAPQVPTDKNEKIAWLRDILLYNKNIPAADINGDGKVNICDLVAVKND